jgi:hypothetical protein
MKAGAHHVEEAGQRMVMLCGPVDVKPHRHSGRLNVWHPAKHAE